MTDTMLALKNVTKTYQGFRLGPIDMEIEPGYIVAVVGPNGSGKSTLFRMLMGLVHPDTGDIRRLDHAIDDDLPLKSRIGYVPERATGHDQMSALELGEFYARWYPAFDRERYDSAIDAMGADWNKRFAALSKGIQRRVSFALAMSTGPEVLLLDELMDGVDPFARKEMTSDISRFMETGERSVLFATHNMDEVARLADYVMFLVSGRFAGMYEKDALLHGWRRAWVEREPGQDTPGIVSSRAGEPVEVISSWWEETACALNAEGIVIERSVPMDMTEILEHLMARMEDDDGDRLWPVAGQTRSVRMP